ncbi:MAG: ATP-dependent helicase, partial [Coriobacteriales bacterium]|nr:ATP-dependent helicase [Coriobacteriales bacterium]
MSESNRIAPQLAAEFARLNPEQRQAVETLDGPVLVVAGPGTGKTQLLALRAANILAQRDVGPRNLLCLTYTDAGAEAMRRRLARFIGPQAFEVTVSTFHGFASALRSRYPEHFSRGALDTLITDLQAARLTNTLLKGLPVSGPLFQMSFNGVHGALAATRDFITRLKRSGLGDEQFSAIIQQNLSCMDYLLEKTGLLSLVSLPLNTGSFAERSQRLDELGELIASLPALVPRELSRPLSATPGIYQPFVVYLAEQFASSELYDSDTR